MRRSTNGDDERAEAALTEADAGAAPGPRQQGGPFLTPFEMAFGEPGFENRIFPRIQAEATEHGEDPLARDRFGFLTLAGEAARDMVPAEAPPEMLEESRALLYQAFNFWRYGKRTYVLEPAVARYLVEAAPVLEGWRLALPVPSVYVRLPSRLFWASISTDVPPEPVDGLFATVCDGRDPLGGTYQHLHVLMVLGLRRGRAGFSVIPFDTEMGAGIPAPWGEPSREDARDFENILPGGEMAGLYSLLTTGEVLKVLARAMWYVEAHPQDVEAVNAPERRAEDRPGQVPLSRLPYHRVRLSGGGIAAEGPAG